MIELSALALAIVIVGAVISALIVHDAVESAKFMRAHRDWQELNRFTFPRIWGDDVQ